MQYLSEKWEIADLCSERECRQSKEKRVVFMLANVRFFRVCWGCLGKVKGKVEAGPESALELSGWARG